MPRMSEAQLRDQLRANPDLAVQDSAPDARPHLALPCVLLLQGAQPPSRNATQRMHWSARHRLYKRIQATVKRALAVHALDSRFPLQQHATLTMRVYFAARRYDVDNVDAKPYIDALKGSLLVDDTPRYLQSHIEVYRDRADPRIELHLASTEAP
jgi:hypothetical protein